LTGAELKAARERLGWSLLEMADALRLEGSEKSALDYVRFMESGKKPVTGPVEVAVASFLRELENS
jgi:transcriptional regulator with XRE-family HTH domain